MDIREIDGLWCDDITFCQEKCDMRDCPRNQCNIRNHNIPHSFSVERPKDCPKEKVMPNREKVIKGLECCKSMDDDCEKCPYNYEGEHGENECLRKQLMPDILELLKGQEAVEPSFKQDEKGIFVWCCGSCGAYMYHIYDGIDKAKEYAKFCRQCGKPVLWEGR